MITPRENAGRGRQRARVGGGQTSSRQSALRHIPNFPDLLALTDYQPLTAKEKWSKKWRPERMPVRSRPRCFAAWAALFLRRRHS